MGSQGSNGLQPDRLEPFAARMTLTAGPGGIAEPARLIARMLTDIAGCCESSGSSVIGHIKCHVEMTTEAGVETFHCNLTSVRLGARCSGDPRPLVPLGVLEIDLVVLVYGLAGPVVEQSVRDSCSGLARHSGSIIEIRPGGSRF